MKGNHACTCDHSVFAFPRHDDPDGDVTGGTRHVTRADAPRVHPTVGKDRHVLRNGGGDRVSDWAPAICLFWQGDPFLLGQSAVLPQSRAVPARGAHLHRSDQAVSLVAENAQTGRSPCAGATHRDSATHCDPLRIGLADCHSLAGSADGTWNWENLVDTP